MQAHSHPEESPEPVRENDTDQDLVRRSHQGDRTAFRSLVERHHRFAYSVAIRILRTDEEACDAVQEAFIRVWNNIGAYRPEIKFTTWLYTIVVNLCYDAIKMDARRNSMLDAAAASGAAQGTTADPHREMEQRELCERILAAGASLPRLQQLIFHLRDVDDLSVNEVALVAGVSTASVKTNLCYARKRIREIILGGKEITR